MGKHLYNRTRVGEWARISVRDGWQDIAWFGTDFDCSGAAYTIEGRVIAVSAHRVSISMGESDHIHVLRRVDVEAIEVLLGR